SPGGGAFCALARGGGPRLNLGALALTATSAAALAAPAPLARAILNAAGRFARYRRFALFAIHRFGQGCAALGRATCLAPLLRRFLAAPAAAAAPTAPPPFFTGLSVFSAALGDLPVGPRP